MRSLLFFTIIFVLSVQNSKAATWQLENFTLSHESPRANFSFLSNLTEYSVWLDPTLLKQYEGDQFAIEVEIQNLRYTPVDSSGGINYFNIWEQVYDGVGMKKWNDISKKMPMADVPAGTKYLYYPTSGHVANYRIKFQPLGDWSSGTNVASFGAQLKIIRSITIGDGMAQREINIDPAVEYDVKLNRRGMTCDTDARWRCSLNLVLNQITYKTPACIQVLPDDQEIQSVCKPIGKNEKLYFEAQDKVTIKASEQATEDFQATFTVSAVMHTTEFHQCPAHYFSCCQSGKGGKTVMHSIFTDEGANCIPDDWTCDGKRNCPQVCAEADEEEGMCRVRSGCPAYWRMSPAAAAWILLPTFFAFIFILVFLYAANSIWGKSKPPSAENPPSYKSCARNTAYTTNA